MSEYNKEPKKRTPTQPPDILESKIPCLPGPLLIECSPSGSSLALLNAISRLDLSSDASLPLECRLTFKTCAYFAPRVLDGKLFFWCLGASVCALVLVSEEVGLEGV